MTNDVTTQITHLKDLAYATLDGLIIDPNYDFKPLLETYKQVLNDLKVDKNENEIHSIVPKSNQHVNNIIALHALINNDSSLSDFQPETTRRFSELKDVVRSIRDGQFEPLVLFIQQNQIRGELLLIYQCMQFLKLIIDKKHKEALLYAKHSVFEGGLLALDLKYHERFSRYLPLLILTSKAKKEYNLLINECVRAVKVEFITLHGITQRDVFQELFDTGSNNIGQLLNFEWVEESDCELPLELKVKSQYHSMFICPILKVLCGEDNPPMRLKCGHVISKDAVDRLVRDRHIASFKCPYCPFDCTMEEVKKINL